MGTGLCNVTCTTLTHFEKRQKGIRPNSVQNLLPATLSGNDVLWFEVAYDHGKVQFYKTTKQVQNYRLI